MPPSVQRALYTPNSQKGDLKSYLDHYHQNDTRDGVVFDLMDISQLLETDCIQFYDVVTQIIKCFYVKFFLLV